MLEIRLLGQFDIRRDGQVVSLPLRPAQSLLAYLLLHPDIPHRREKLAGLIWPDLPEPNARGNLRHTLWRLRKALGAERAAQPECLLADELTVAFNFHPGVWLDTRVLEQRHAGPPNLAALLSAAEVYRGDLLPGFYDDWVCAERERLQAAFETQMAHLLDALLEVERWDDVLDWGERWIGLGHTPELGYRALIVAHANRGDLAAAADLYQRCRKALRDQLGIEPSPATRAAYESARRGAHWRAPPAPAPSASTLHNLPAPVSTFVGRERERDDLHRLIADPSNRLVTVTGPAGCGKTRLALEAARHLLPRFSDGAWLVELAPLDSAEAVPAAVCAALGLRPVPGFPPAETLAAALRDRRMLLLLDNCEHVLDEVAALALHLLEQCPALKVLVTSREMLSLAGERVYSLAGLGVPYAAGGLEQLLASEAGRLLVARATAASPDFVADQDNASDLIRLCRGLDGLPLALELAAARLAGLSPREAAVRLDERLQLLVGSRVPLARHRSLEAAISWSHELLTPSEQQVFTRLSVFRGGWTLEAAEAVCAGDGVLAGAVPSLLRRLVDQSLVQTEAAALGGARYRLLESLREYAHQCLSQSGQLAHVSQRHADYYRRLAEMAEAGFPSSNEPLEMARVTADVDNLFVAMRRSLELDSGAAALCIGGALSWYLANTAHRWAEYVELVTRAAALAPAVSPQCRSKALAQASYFHYLSGQVDLARALAGEAVQLARASADAACLADALVAQGFSLIGEASRSCYSAAVQLARANRYRGGAIALRFLAESEPPATARALLQEYHHYALSTASPTEMGSSSCGLADLAFSLGQLAEAERHWQECAQFCEQLNNRWNRADVLQRSAGSVWARGDYDQAAALLDEALDLVHQSGWMPELAFAFRYRGIVAWRQEHFAQAGEWFQQSDAFAARWNRPAVGAVTGIWRARFARDVGDLTQAEALGQAAREILLNGAPPGRLPLCQATLASIAHHQGDPACAVALYREALRSMPFDRNLLDLRDVLEGHALALAAAEPSLAARLLGFTAARLAAFGVVRPVPEQRFYDQELARLKASLPTNVLVPAWDSGSSLTFEQAVAEALGESQPPPPSTPPSSP